MSSNAYDLSAGVFVRGLSNLKKQLTKAESHAAARSVGESELLYAQLATELPGPGSGAPNDLHEYNLAAHVHWAAEAARLAISHLLGTPSAPAASDAKSFAELHQRLDQTIACLSGIAPGELEAGLDRAIVIEHRRGSTHSGGGQFLLAFAIPHFYYHLTSAYGILRNQGVPLTMGDFLGNWGTS